ncbi:9671_t:CDS:2, partial [Cetraspora pellucida]
DHNHLLNIDAIVFESDKKFSNEMMEDIQFLTQHCKMGATAQKKYLEGKYLTHAIFNKDLYTAIRKFRPTANSLSNDAAQMSDWLDLQKEKDSWWVIARGWDDNNALTYLIWMTPEQVENWIQFSDCVINDVTHKTNRYGMALSFFVRFNRNRQNILLAQANYKSYQQQPTVILTDSDPAVDAVVRKVFQTTYPIHCAFHITQNIHKNLRKQLGNQYEKFLHDFYNCKNSLVQETFQNRFIKLLEDYPSRKHYLEVLYKSKEYWAHSYTVFKFTGGMISTSRVEAMNACLKKLLYNSNLAIPSLKNLEHTNFLFTKVNKCCQEFLTSEILNMQRDEINQSLYYVAYLVNKQDVLFSEDLNATLSNDENQSVDDPQATICQLLGVVNFNNVNEI